MEAWSVSPVRVAAVLVVASGGTDLEARAELRVVGRLTLLVGPPSREGAGDVTVEVGATQPLPEGDELGFLDEGAAEADFTLPPNRKAARRIAGQHLDGETLFAFRGAPEPLAKLRLPTLRPRLFVTTGSDRSGGRALASAREATWSLGGVSLDVVDRTISVCWRARVPLEPRDRADVVIVSLDRAAAHLSFAELLSATRRFDPTFVQQRAKVERRTGDVERIAVPHVPPLSVAAAARPMLVDDDTASMGAAELEAAVATAMLPALPPEVQLPRPSTADVPVAVPPRRSIGEILSLDPSRARPASPASSAPAVPEPKVERALERIFAADDAGARVRRRFPDLAKPLKRNQDVDVQDRLAVAAVAREAPRVAVGALADALARAVAAELLSADVVVVSTEVFVALEPEPALRALVAAARPLARASEALAKATQEANARLVTPGPPALARLDEELSALRARLERLLGRDAARDLEDAAFEKLLCERRVREVPVLGEPCAVLHAEDRVPVYVPAAFLPELPLQLSFRARILGAPRPRYDELESSPVALFALAMFRELAL